MQSISQTQTKPSSPDLFLEAGEEGIVKIIEKEFKAKDIGYGLEYSINRRGEVKHIKITKTLYQCCANKKVLYIGEGNVKDYRVEIYVVRDGKRDDIMTLEFSDYSTESPQFLNLDILKTINSIHQIKRYIKVVLTYIKFMCTMSIDSFM